MVQAIERITSLSPGQRPSQVTIPQVSCEALKKSFSLGPAASIAVEFAASAIHAFRSSSRA